MKLTVMTAMAALAGASCTKIERQEPSADSQGVAPVVARAPSQTPAAQGRATAAPSQTTAAQGTPVIPQRPPVAATATPYRGALAPAATPTGRAATPFAGGPSGLSSAGLGRATPGGSRNVGGAKATTAPGLGASGLGASHTKVEDGWIWQKSLDGKWWMPVKKTDGTIPSGKPAARAAN